MANLIETSTFPVGIYQLERGDGVDAGVGGSGIANLQPTQLAARTRFLKDVLDAAGLDLTNTSFRVPNLTIASLPPAVANVRKIFFATNANAGAGSLVISDGTNWIDVRTGLTVSTTATSITTGATTTTSGTVILATNGEAIAGTDSNKAITSSALQAKINAIPSLGAATTSTAGTVILATNAEALTGTNATKSITPAALQAKVDTVTSPPATDTVPGIIQIATQVETRALTISNKAISPNALAGILPSIASAGGQFARVNPAGTSFSYTLEDTSRLVVVIGGTFNALPNRYHFFTSGCTVTLPVTPPEGTYVAFFNAQTSGTITISATGTDAHNATLGQNLRGNLIYSAGNWRNVGFSAGSFVVSGNAVFAYTGSNQSWVVPGGVTAATALLWAGGGGGGGTGGTTGGGGSGFVQVTFTTTPGETLTMIVGQGGQSWTDSNTGDSANAFGGGGFANRRAGGNSGAGGGRSAIRRSDTELFTAGAGGGGSPAGVEQRGGFGGGTVGGSGNFGTIPAGGGTQSVGGVASNNFGGNATPGSLHVGGNASTTGTGFGATGGCGGGGGYFGGGGSDLYAAGGGSSFTGTGTTNPVTIAGTQSVAANNTHPSYVAGIGNGGPGGNNTPGGNGRIVLTWG